MKQLKLATTGLVTGVINGLLGVGGGTFLIPALTHIGKIKQHLAHGTTISVILPLAITSATIYGVYDRIDFALAIKVIISGSLGSFLGAKLMNYLQPKLLKRFFAVFIISTGLWLVLT